jgi:hypothetical protein
MVIPDYMADCVKTGALFQSGVLTAAERRRRKLANDEESLPTTLMVRQHLRGKKKKKSFFLLTIHLHTLADDASGMINSDVPGVVKVKSFDLESDIIYDARFE